MDAATAGSHNPYPVTPTGFLIGSYLAFGLYGIHLTQLYTYFTNYSDPFRTKALVTWVFLLSTLQMAIIMGSGYRYFVGGISEPGVWGTFLWPLSFQDGLIPMMAYTGQLYFGRRAHILLGRRRWFGILVFVCATVTLGCGIALAVTARLWAESPWVSALEWAHTTKTIGVPSQVVAITWMGMSAFVDGSITLILIIRLRPHRSSSPFLVKRLITLTLETVLLTHMCGAAMCIIFLASPAKHRTDKDIFWVLIEIITELYALSILFTVNSRRFIRDPDSSFGTSSDRRKTDDGETMFANGFGVSEVERRVEGYQGDTPFGVAIQPLTYAQNHYGMYESAHPPIPHNPDSSTGTYRSTSGTDSSGFAGQTAELGYSMRSLTSAASPLGPMTPADDLDKQLLSADEK